MLSVPIILWSKTIAGLLQSILSGEVKIGLNTFLGVGCTIVNKVDVGSYNIIGAGATITKCTNAYEVYLTKSGGENTV